MAPFLKPAPALAGLVALSLAGVHPADAQQQPPRPLYNTIAPERRDRPPLPVSPDIVLTDHDTGAGPAASVEEANGKFTARAAEAIRYTTDHRDELLTVPASKDTPAEFAGTKRGFYNEERFGFTILAMMAYKDFFNDDGRARGQEYRQEAYYLLVHETAGTVGTSPDKDLLPKALGSFKLKWQGEYDVLLQSYLTLYYKYFDVLPLIIQEKLINELLSVAGPHPGLRDGIYAFLGEGTIIVPETENHEFMIESARYLTNQLLFQREVASAASAHRAPDHSQYDNNRNGNPPLVDYILRKLQDILKHDFIEYNARPYQDYTMVAILNLASYAYDDRVRLAARMALDYVSAKVAVSSNHLMRSTPFRRRNEEHYYGPTERFGDHSYLSTNLATSDPQTMFYSMLAGNTEVWRGHAAANGAYEMVHAGLRDYRVPSPILDIFVTASHRRFYQRFHHAARTVGGDTGQYADELYAGSPNYLISAGGNPTYFAYVVRLPLVPDEGDGPDRGVAVPTTLMPTSFSWFGAAPSPLLSFLAQAGGFGTEITQTSNMGVAPDFVCGDIIYLPDTYLAGKGFYFINGDGMFMAVYGVDSTSRGGHGARMYLIGGFIEAFDTSLHPGVSFEDFKAAVLAKNGATVFHFPGENEYVTFAGQRIRFKIAPGTSEIISTTDARGATGAFASGTVLNSDQESAVIRISNPDPGAGTIILDMHDQATGEDPLYGLHHPTRTSETGAVEKAGSNNEVWVNFNYTATGLEQSGDFGDPFKTLAAARDHVAVGGTINIMPGSRMEPIVIKKALTLKSFPGSATVRGR